MMTTSGWRRWPRLSGAGALLAGLGLAVLGATPTPSAAQSGRSTQPRQADYRIEAGTSSGTAIDRAPGLFAGTALSTGEDELFRRTPEAVVATRGAGLHQPGPTALQPFGQSALEAFRPSTPHPLQQVTGASRHPVMGALIGAGVAALVLGVAEITKDCGIDYCSGGVDPKPALIFGGSMTAAGLIVGSLIRTGG